MNYAIVRAASIQPSVQLDAELIIKIVYLYFVIVNNSRMTTRHAPFTYYSLLESQVALCRARPFLH